MATKRTLAARSIHVRIMPRPANLSESREILRVLRRFGDISIFKYMKYEYQNPLNNVALAIFRDERAAQEALKASPIRFTLERPDTTNSESTSAASEEEDYDSFRTAESKKDDSIDDIIRPSTLLASPLPESPPPPSTPSSKPSPFDPPTEPHPRKFWKKPFLLTLDHSHAVQADFIERQPFYKQFNPMRSLAQQDLVKIVPHPGLSDISKRPPGHFRTPIKVLGAMRQYVEQVMPRLKDMGKDAREEGGKASG